MTLAQKQTNKDNVKKVVGGIIGIALALIIGSLSFAGAEDLETLNALEKNEENMVVVKTTTTFTSKKGWVVDYCSTENVNKGAIVNEKYQKEVKAVASEDDAKIILHTTSVEENGNFDEIKHYKTVEEAVISAYTESKEDNNLHAVTVEDAKEVSSRISETKAEEEAKKDVVVEETTNITVSEATVLVDNQEVGQATITTNTDTNEKIIVCEGAFEVNEDR